MMELARKNAQNVLIQDSEKLKREEHRTIGAVHELEQLLGIENLNRMEAFDISNTNGYENVASMVVFEKGKAKRKPPLPCNQSGISKGGNDEPDQMGGTGCRGF